jgi:hypothetical protein
MALIRYQLTGPAAKLRKQRERKVSLDDIRIAVIEFAQARTSPSVRAIAKRLNVSPSTISRSVVQDDLRRIQTAYTNTYDDSPNGEAARQSGWALLQFCIGESNLVDCRAFTLAYEMVMANPDLPEAELLTMVAKALAGSGAAIQLRVAPES